MKFVQNFSPMSDDIRIPVKLFVSKFPTSFLEDDLREVCMISVGFVSCF